MGTDLDLVSTNQDIITSYKKIKKFQVGKSFSEIDVETSLSTAYVNKWVNTSNESISSQDEFKNKRYSVKKLNDKNCIIIYFFLYIYNI